MRRNIAITQQKCMQLNLKHAKHTAPIIIPVDIFLGLHVECDAECRRVLFVFAFVIFAVVVLIVAFKLHGRFHIDDAIEMQTTQSNKHDRLTGIWSSQYTRNQRKSSSTGAPPQTSRRRSQTWRVRLKTPKLIVYRSYFRLS